MSKNNSKAPISKLVSLISRHHQLIYTLLIGFLTGVTWLIAMRFYLVKTPETHYHANFAVYIDGIREEFKDFTYYEEVAACTADYANNPQGRVHMHNQVSDVIHVHDKRVTYGNFFQNIGWNIGDEYLVDRDKVYQPAGNKKLTYWLDGQEVDRVDDMIIGNTDRLLVSFGNESVSELQKQFDSIAKTAIEVNNIQDPVSCSGLNGAGHESFINRLKRASFWQ